MPFLCKGFSSSLTRRKSSSLLDLGQEHQTGFRDNTLKFRCSNISHCCLKLTGAQREATIRWVGCSAGRVRESRACLGFTLHHIIYANGNRCNCRDARHIHPRKEWILSCLQPSTLVSNTYPSLTCSCCFTAGVVPPWGFTPCMAHGGDGDNPPKHAPEITHLSQAQQQRHSTRLPGDDSSRRLVLGAGS